MPRLTQPLLTALVLAVALMLPVAPASAGTPSPYEDDPTGSLLTASSSWLVAGGLLFANRERPVPDLSGRQASMVNALDRLAIGPVDSTAARWSDALLLMLVAAPYVVDTVDVALDGGSALGLGRDSLVFAEVQGVTAAITQLFKLAGRRARPYVFDASYDAAAATHDDDHSFFSGHASLAFASAVALGATYARRHRGTAENWVWAGLLAGATTVGVLRVHASKHFWTDVLAGAAVGSLVGYLVTEARATSSGGGSGQTSVQIGLTAQF